MIWKRGKNCKHSITIFLSSKYLCCFMRILLAIFFHSFFFTPPMTLVKWTTSVTRKVFLFCMLILSNLLLSCWICIILRRYFMWCKPLWWCHVMPLHFPPAFPFLSLLPFFFSVVAPTIFFFSYTWKWLHLFLASCLTRNNYMFHVAHKCNLSTPQL